MIENYGICNDYLQKLGPVSEASAVVARFTKFMEKYVNICKCLMCDVCNAYVSLLNRESRTYLFSTYFNKMLFSLLDRPCIHDGVIKVDHFR